MQSSISCSQREWLITPQLFAVAFDLATENCDGLVYLPIRDRIATRTANIAPSFCSLLTVKKVIFSVSLPRDDVVK